MASNFMDTESSRDGPRPRASDNLAGIGEAAPEGTSEVRGPDFLLGGDQRHVLELAFLLINANHNLQECKHRSGAGSASLALMEGLEQDRLLVRNLSQWARKAPSAVAKQAKLAATTLLRPYNGTADTRMSRATIQKLQDAFPAFPGWDDRLALDAAHVSGGDPGEGGELTAETQGAAEQLGVAMIPELVDYAFGLGGTYSDALTEVRHVPFRRDWLSRRARGATPDVFLTRGRGTSMEPTIRDSDDILVNRSENVITDQDEIWAVAYGQIGTIKRVRRLPGGGWELHSDNKLVPPIALADDELHVVGRVIWIGRGV